MTSDNTMPRNKTFTTRKMVTVAMLSAIATVIYYLDFPVPLMPGFIKLDLSNVISLLAGFSMGPIAGVIVCLIKNVIQLIIKGLGTTMGIGISCQLLRIVFVKSKTVHFNGKREPVSAFTINNKIDRCFVKVIVFHVMRRSRVRKIRISENIVEPNLSNECKIGIFWS